ncbi:MAG: 3-hydroxy-3-methylglutaryl-CoA reductase, partial [Anaerolineaceae bacterium]|nr:3-hydroxy-3-methylglutaryl-CoA reductase [Anaerolineaceae bacterium]
MTKKFYQMTLPERWQTLQETSDMDTAQIAAINGEAGLRLEQANHMIENVVGLYALPLGVAQHFVINGVERQVPMVIEEPSVVAAASYMAKLVKAGGGFTAKTTSPEMIGQIQLLDLEDPTNAKAAILAEKESLLALTAEIDPILTKLGGGPRDLVVRELFSETLG